MVGGQLNLGFAPRGGVFDEVYAEMCPNALRSTRRLPREGAWWQTRAPLRDVRRRKPFYQIGRQYWLERVSFGLTLSLHGPNSPFAVIAIITLIVRVPRIVKSPIAPAREKIAILKPRPEKFSLRGRSWHENRGIPRGRHKPRGTLKLGDALTWGFFPRPKINPRWNAKTEPSSWETSVFVPESSRIAALIERENASGATLHKQPTAACSIAALRPAQTAAAHRLPPGWAGARQNNSFSVDAQLHFRPGACPPSLTPSRLSAFVYALARTPSCAILPLARPSSRLAIYWNPTQLPSPPGCKGAIS